MWTTYLWRSSHGAGSDDRIFANESQINGVGSVPASGAKNEYDAGSKRCLAAWLETVGVKGQKTSPTYTLWTPLVNQHNYGKSP